MHTEKHCLDMYIHLNKYIYIYIIMYKSRSTTVRENMVDSGGEACHDVQPARSSWLKQKLKNQQFSRSNQFIHTIWCTSLVSNPQHRKITQKMPNLHLFHECSAPQVLDTSDTGIPITSVLIANQSYLSTCESGQGNGSQFGSTTFAQSESGWWLNHLSEENIS